MRHTKKHLTVLGSSMAYVTAGAGPPIVFLHGNPTSSFLWRNVIPHVQHQGRVIAPDLIGMGDSAKLPGGGDDRYRFAAHRRYVDALLDALDVRDRVVLVLHDWGSALGFDWARRHPEAAAGIAYMEAIVGQFTWEALGEAGEFFRALRSEAGDHLVLGRNAFLETMLPMETVRTLGGEALREYRRPFETPGEDRRPTLTWPREVPIEGQPADVAAIVDRYASFLAQTEIPKYVWRAAWCFHPDAEPAAAGWVAAHALKLLAGDVDSVIAALNQRATDAGLTTHQRHGIDACIGYLQAKREFLAYDTALQAGWPIATGVIEGACRHLVGDRLDITGARWGLHGAEAVLKLRAKLRALVSNGDFDRYRAYHLAQQHQRVHQARYQATPALAA